MGWFSAFERLVDPYPETVPATPPAGFWPFLRASTQGLGRWIAAMTVDSPDLSLGTKFCLAARKHGLLTRPIGNTIVLMPPLCVTLEELGRMVKALRDALNEVTAPQ